MGDYRDFGPLIRVEATTLTLRILNKVTADRTSVHEAHDITCGRHAGVRHVLYGAAEVLVHSAKAGGPLPGGDDLLRASLVQAEWTPKKWGRLPKKVRTLVERMMGMMVEECRPSPDGPDGAPTDDPAPADADGDLSHQEEIDAATTSVLRQYRHNVGTLGPAAADSWLEADLAREACRIVPNTDSGRHPDWQRVHDMIRRRFYRFVIHIDDSQSMPDGDCQVWIKGWDNWVPARIERDGRTWKLPIGRVSGEHIENLVAAVRPMAA